MMNFITTARAQLAFVKSALFSMAGTLADLERDIENLRLRAHLISERNNDRANDLENQRAALEAEIERLDAETDECDLIRVGAHRLLGKA